MYITQNIAVRIKLTAKSKNISMKKLLSNCDLNVNAVSEFSKGKQLSCISLAKIADYLDCSVDYLLGRVDTPNATYSISNQNTTVTGTQANVINNNNTIEKTDTITEEFMQTFKQLTLADKVAVMEFTMKKINK